MRVSQTTAKLQCEVQGWTLAMPKNGELYQDLVSQLPGSSTWWIGLERKPRDDDALPISLPISTGGHDIFVWHDGSQLVWANWDVVNGQPDDSGLDGEDCVVMLSTATLPWWDVPCFLSRYYICEGG